MDWPIIGGGQYMETGGAIEASTAASYVATNAVAHTKGAWGEVIASTGKNASGLLVIVGGGTTGEFLYDIGIGASGSEKVLLANLYFGMAHSSQYRNFMSFFLPIFIPAGSRISVRGQSSVGGTSKGFVFVLVSSGWESQGLNKIETLGANTVDSGGTSIDPGGSANTKGSYAEITAATGHRYKALLISFGQQANAARTACYWLVDIAIGAAGSEKVIISDLIIGGSNNTMAIHPRVIGPIPVDIPAGTRIAVRAQCTITDATDRLFDNILYGIG